MLIWAAITSPTSSCRLHSMLLHPKSARISHKPSMRARTTPRASPMSRRRASWSGAVRRSTDLGNTCAPRSRIEAPPVDIAGALAETRTDVLVSYLPVGSQRATEFYAERALEAGCAFVNCIPVFIASDENWRRRFERRGFR